MVSDGFLKPRIAQEHWQGLRKNCDMGNSMIFQDPIWLTLTDLV